MPRRGGGSELCHYPKFFVLPQSSLPHRLRAEPPPRGGQEILLYSFKKGDNMYVLGIESTCDETAAAIVEDGRKVISNVISTSVKEQAL